MRTIKFSHKYSKMPDDVTNTHLLEVFKTSYKELSPQFRVYDTEHNNGYYELPRSELLVLVLLSFEDNVSGGFNEHLWTTIRRYTQEKESYYKGIRGEQVNIEVDDNAN